MLDGRFAGKIVIFPQVAVYAAAGTRRAGRPVPPGYRAAPWDGRANGHPKLSDGSSRPMGSSGFVITTLTPNPSFDRTLRVNALERGEVHGHSSCVVECAGKGVNVARALAVNETPARAVFRPTTAISRCSMPRCRHWVMSHASGSRIIRRKHRGRARWHDDEDQRRDQNSTRRRLRADTRRGDRCGPRTGSSPAGASRLEPGRFYIRSSPSRSPTQRSGSLSIQAVKPLELLVGTPCAVVSRTSASLVGLTRQQMCTVGDVVDAARDLRDRGWGSVLSVSAASGLCCE